MSIRIIAGKFRRRVLHTPVGKSTRPFTDRVRQAVFDRLGDQVTDAHVADVYSGVGTMGIEALSRGARSCVFFETDRTVHQLLRNNVQAIASDEDTLCWRANVRTTSFRPKGFDQGLPYSLIFFDPPYADVNELLPGQPLAKSLRRLARPGIVAPTAKLVLRTPLRFDPGIPEGWTLDEHWEMSSMSIRLLSVDTMPAATETDTRSSQQAKPFRSDGAAQAGEVSTDVSENPNTT